MMDLLGKFLTRDKNGVSRQNLIYYICNRPKPTLRNNCLFSIDRMYSLHYILEDSEFQFRYVRLCNLISERKMVELFANSGDPDQTPRSAVLFATYPFRGLQITIMV